MKSTTVALAHDAVLALADPAVLGASSGYLWRGHDVVLAGVGPSVRIPLTRPGGVVTAQAALQALAGDNELPDQPGTGPLAFAALPFDRTAAGHLDVPSIVLGESAGTRWLTVLDPLTEADAVRRIVAILEDDRVRPRPSSITVTPTRAADDWRDQVVRVARDRIRAGELRKAVMSRQLELEADVPFDVASIALKLHRSFPGAMVFSIDGFVGASPELLVSRSDRRVNAHPLAGTAARGIDAVADSEQKTSLLASTKDRREHQITIDWLLTELLPFCSYVDAEPEPSVVTMPNVHHLGTIVEGMLSEPAASVLDLVEAVHPTPALGGDPQAAAIELIEELEGYDRGRYGGPAGWVDASGNGAFAVSIRTAQLDGSRASVAAGVGVVAQSDPDAELEETQAKFRAILGAVLAPPT